MRKTRPMPQTSPPRLRFIHLRREKRLSSSSFTPSFVLMYAFWLPMMVMSTTSGALSSMNIGWGAASYVVGMRLLVVCRWRRLTLIPLVGPVESGAANTAPTILRSLRRVRPAVLQAVERTAGGQLDEAGPQELQLGLIVLDLDSVRVALVAPCENTTAPSRCSRSCP